MITLLRVKYFVKFFRKRLDKRDYFAIIPIVSIGIIGKKESIMKLSTKARYGTRTMLDLALNYGKGPVQVKEIAKRQEVSPKYLEHLIASLKAAGLVKAIRGFKGGYLLSRSPDQINLIEIIEVLEGSISLVDCVNDPEACSRQKSCAARDIWASMTNAMTEILNSTTLEDMVEGVKEKEHTDAKMYYI